MVDINPLYLQIGTAILIGLGAGYVGSFMILRKMALVGDALSHVALPGIAISILLQINPFIGAFAALFLAVIGVWALEKKTSLSSETLVGIFFTLSLAIGILITPEPELLEALFGDITKVSLFDTLATLILVALIFIAINRIRRGLILGIISKDLTQSMKISIDKINFVFLLAVSVVVALGLKVAGTLLMGSLVIIPAAAARNVALSMSRYTFFAGIFGIISALGGYLFAQHFGLIPGPIIVLASGLIFLVTLLFKK